MHHAPNAGASSDPTPAISDHRRELKALQTHNVTPIWEELIGEPPNAPVRPSHFSSFSLLRSRGVLRQPLQHPLCGRHLTFSLCLSYHSAATTSEHARNANDIKILSRKQPHIQTPQYVKALLLSASETTVFIACKLQTMCTRCREYMKAVGKSRYRAISEFPWWNGARHKHGHVCGRLNAETDGMAWGVWNYLMWLKSCLCQRLTLVSVSYTFLSFIVQQHCITTAGQVSVKTREDPWAVSLIFSCP